MNGERAESIVLNSCAALRRWCFRDRDYQLGAFPLLMGIVNVTPDSFSDGGRFLNVDDAVRQATKLVEDGAGILDVGGESTRPGSQPVPLEEELARVVPAIRAIAAETDVPISVDTTKAAVARAALEAGASIVNDISGLTFDPEMPAICRELEAGIVCMHIRGTPLTMQRDPRYDDVVAEVATFLEQRLAAIEAAGIPRERVVLDPGVGFGKTAAHNVEILTNIARFRDIGRPVLIGHSRKRFLGKVLGRSVDERDCGTLGVSLGLALQATDLLRIHDVRATRDALLGMAVVLPK